MSISQVAARSGVPPSTLRYYEDLGLPHPERAANGYRVFDADSLERLRFIGAAKQLHLPLKQIASLMTVWESDACSHVKARRQPLLSRQLDEVDDGIAELPDHGERCGPDCVGFAPAPPAQGGWRADRPRHLSAQHRECSGGRGAGMLPVLRVHDRPARAAVRPHHHGTTGGHGHAR